jgi:rhodanese-related sulfurtransferase
MDEQLRHYADKLADEIDAWDLKVALEAGENVVVLDARSAEAYAREHISGAVNFPHRAMNEESTRHLEKDALVVTYCDGIGCNASTKGALNMARLGFRVKELIGGLDWWKRDDHKTEGGAGNDQAACRTIPNTAPPHRRYKTRKAYRERLNRAVSPS